MEELDELPVRGNWIGRTRTGAILGSPLRRQSTQNHSQRLMIDPLQKKPSGFHPRALFYLLFLGSFQNFLKRFWESRGEVREHFAIQFDLVFLQSAHELAV